jgi:hypothetical protein
MENLIYNMRAGIKYLLSFAKDDWVLTDYPIRFRHSPSSDAGGRLKPIPWTAQIINWWQVDGFGETKQQAYVDLETKFNRSKADGKSLPRPGTGLPIEFAPVFVLTPKPGSALWDM